MTPDHCALSTIVLAGGCFWCTQAVFDRVRGVRHVVCGYANGHLDRPSYEAVCAGDSGHAEAVEVRFDPTELALADVLAVFFATHDPTTLNAQGHDVGTQYRSGVYATSAQQLQQVRAFVADWTARRVLPKPIVTELELLRCFWPAEPEHQSYFDRHPQQPYCRWVAAPKVRHLQTAWAHLVKDAR